MYFSYIDHFHMTTSRFHFHQMLCRSQILALCVFFLLYADHRKYYTKIRCQKSRSENERCENDLYVFSYTTNTKGREWK